MSCALDPPKRKPRGKAGSSKLTNPRTGYSQIRDRQPSILLLLARYYATALLAKMLGKAFWFFLQKRSRIWVRLANEQIEL